MDIATKQKYDDYLTSVRVTKSMIETAKLRGRIEGREEGYEEGREEGREVGLDEKNTKIILKMYDLGQEVSFIAEVVEMKEDEVLQILKDSGRL